MTEEKTETQSQQKKDEKDEKPGKKYDGGSIPKVSKKSSD